MRSPFVPSPSDPWRALGTAAGIAFADANAGVARDSFSSMPHAIPTTDQQQSHPSDSPAQPTRQTSAPRSWWIHLAIVLGAVVFTALFLAQYDTPELLLLRYFTVFLVSTTMPGMLLWRALSSGGRGTLVDLAMGTGLGILVQLVLWFIFVSFGIGEWLLLGSVLQLVPFLAVPRMRRFWTSVPQEERVPTWVTAALVGLYSLTLVRFSETFTSALPPAANNWYQDQYWHLGNAAGLLTRNHLIDMRVAHDALTYHWLPSAHTASQALTTGIDLPLLFTRMWVVPLFAAVVVLAAAAGKNLTGQWWPGVLAAGMVVLTPDLSFTGVHIPGGPALHAYSGSQTFSVVILLMILYLFITLLRRNRLSAGEWIVLGTALLTAPGSKSTVLPVLICGLALGLLMSLIRRRNRRTMAIALGATVVAFVAVLPILGDDGTGARFKLFSSLRNSNFYPSALGLSPAEQEFGGGILPMSVLTYLGLVTFAVIALSYVVSYAWVWVGLPALRKGSGHEGGWVLLGMGIAGLAAMMIIDHDGKSQVYFFKTGLLGWYLLATWGLHLLSQRLERPVHAIAAGALSGAAAMSLLRSVIPDHISPERPLYSLALVVATTLVILTFGALLLLFSIDRTRRQAVALGAASAAIAGSLLFPITSLSTASPDETQSWAISSEEFRAADWLRMNSDPQDIVATNAHCWGSPSPDQCNTRSFWVSGFTERPVLIEGWAYTDEAHSAHGVNGDSFALQPFYDAELWELNEAAFSNPRAETMAALRAEGVTWLFAAAQRSDLANDIGSFATEVFSNGDVTIYRLD